MSYYIQTKSGLIFPADECNLCYVLGENNAPPTVQQVEGRMQEEAVRLDEFLEGLNLEWEDVEAVIRGRR